MKKIAVLLPCYNEGEVLFKFNELMIKKLADLKFNFELIYINDGSIDNTEEIVNNLNSEATNVNITLLNLNYNMGHQLAIYQGFLYTQKNIYNNILIMDSDGEDDPSAIKEILQYNDNDLVQVVRGKRNESVFFKSFYSIYKAFFVLIIGKKLNFGNYSLIKPKLVNAAVDYSFNHLAAFLDNQRCKKTQIQWDRSKRIDGVSKMNFTSLFYHAVNSFAENAQSLLFVFIKLSAILLIGIFFLSGIILYKKYFIQVAVSGWSSTILGTLFNSLLISMGVFVLGSLQLNILTKQTTNKKEKKFNIKTIVTNWS